MTSCIFTTIMFMISFLTYKKHFATCGICLQKHTTECQAAKEQFVVCPVCILGTHHSRSGMRCSVLSDDETTNNTISLLTALRRSHIRYQKLSPMLANSLHPLICILRVTSKVTPLRMYEME